MNDRPYRNSYLSGLRGSLLTASLLGSAGSFGMRRPRLSGGRPLTARERAGWLHDGSRNILRRIGMEVVTEGDPPLHGLVVSNHLSYADVLVYASLFPCLFVSKQEVSGWPVMGRLVTMAGTIYIDRDRSAANRDATALMEQALTEQLPVILFPEGTSSDGSTVLPFRSPFFEPAVKTQAEVTASAIAYQSATARESELAYYGEDVFAPHLMRTLGQIGVQAHVAFATDGRRYADRKVAARTTQAEVEVLRQAVVSRPRGPESDSGTESYRLNRAG